MERCFGGFLFLTFASFPFFFLCVSVCVCLTCVYVYAVSVLCDVCTPSSG